MLLNINLFGNTQMAHIAGKTCTLDPLNLYKGICLGWYALHIGHIGTLYLFVRSEQPSCRKLHLFTPDMQAKAFCTRCLCKHARKCPYDTGLGCLVNVRNLKLENLGNKIGSTGWNGPVWMPNSPNPSETLGFQCLGHSNLTICSLLSQFCSPIFQTSSVSY